MAAVNAHVLIGQPRRFGTGLYPELIAMLRDDGPLVRWQVEKVEPDGTALRTVVAARLEDAAVALGVAIHTAFDSPFLNAIVDPPQDRTVHLEDLDPGVLGSVIAAMEQNPIAASAIVTWTAGSPFGGLDVDKLTAWLAGDVESCTTVWSQTGSAHDGFGTPGQRWQNPAWRGQ